MKERLSEHLATWESKPALRAVYEDCYRRIVAQCVPGLTLELGGGTGNLRSLLDGIITSDIQWANWMDMVADAQQLPLKDASLGNIVMFDALHHIEYPALFLGEVQRVLQAGGRLIVCEPAITALSRHFYRHFHSEPVDMNANPLATGEITRGRDPYLANQAIPTLLFTRYRHHLETSFQALRIVRTEFFSLFAYPLSGGFRSWSFVPKATAQLLMRFETMIPCWLNNLGAFRLVGVIEHS
jgi:SAM-dependent methyltransferase